jgi:hypothetical protein
MTVHTVRVTGDLPRSPRARMTRAGVLTSSAVPFAWGGALVLIGLGSGALVGANSSTAGRIGGLMVATYGLVVFLWAALSLSSGRMITPRAAVIGCLAGIVAAVALLALEPAHTSVVSVAAATALLAATAVCTVGSARQGGPPTPLRAWALVAAAAVVAVVVTPALGAAQDAVLRSDDGTTIVVPAHEGH